MDLQLYSIDHAPSAVPLWDLMLADLGNPPAARVARVLGVGRATVYRWNRTGNAPRVAGLALFWLTRWGRSSVHAQATRDAILAVQLARALHEERAKLRAELAQARAEFEMLQRSIRAQAIPAGDPPAPAGSAAALAWPSLQADEWPRLTPPADWPADGSEDEADRGYRGRVGVVGTKTSPISSPVPEPPARSGGNHWPPEAGASAAQAGAAAAGLPAPVWPSGRATTTAACGAPGPANEPPSGQPPQDLRGPGRPSAVPLLRRLDGALPGAPPQPPAPRAPSVDPPDRCAPPPNPVQIAAQRPTRTRRNPQ